MFALRRDVASARSNIFSVEEKDTAAFVQADSNTRVVRPAVRGDIGVRFVRTDQDSEGFAEAGANTEKLNVSRSYDDWLPSLNLAIEATDDLLVRFSASRVMTRPPLSQLTPGGSVNVFGGTRLVNQGNPELDPIEADAFDASVEWYFAPESVAVCRLLLQGREDLHRDVANDAAVQHAGHSAVSVGWNRRDAERRLRVLASGEQRRRTAARRRSESADAVHVSAWLPAKLRHPRELHIRQLRHHVHRESGTACKARPVARPCCR